LQLKKSSSGQSSKRKLSVSSPFYSLYITLKVTWNTSLKNSSKTVMIVLNGDQWFPNLLNMTKKVISFKNILIENILKFWMKLVT